MRIAVITGASSGMGREFVRRISEIKNPDQIWVIARRKEKLEELKNEIKTPIRIFALDLTVSESLCIYTSALAEAKPEVEVLVNAGGYGKFGAFTDIPLEEQLGMIDLNSKALVSMTYATIPYMKRGGEIYQLCSLSSFQPVPYIAVYGASKSFVLSFSRAINKELKGKGIKVMAVSPGWVKTDFFDRAVNDDTITYYNRFYTASQVVERALRDMKKGKDVSICGIAIRNQVRLTKLLPHKLVMWIWCKQQKKN